MFAFNDLDIEAAIDSAAGRIIEEVLWPLTEGRVLDLEQVSDVIDDAHGDETAAIGLDLGQQISIVQEGAENYGYEDLSYPIDSLRSQIEAHAVMFIHLQAQERARQVFDELSEFMEEHDLEPEQMTTSNNLGWLPHAAEREEAPATVYEYRHVEDRGNHIDLWDYPIGDSRVYFQVQVRLADR